jgi:hypothetical protein
MVVWSVRSGKQRKRHENERALSRSRRRTHDEYDDTTTNGKTKTVPA